MAARFDDKTVTPSDYTLHLTLKEEQSEQFEQYYLTKMLDDGTDKSRGELFI